MKKLISLLFAVTVIPAYADVLDIDIALNNTKAACGGISELLKPLKTMAGVNTGITGVGTAVNAGATVVGVIKSQKDKKIEELEKILAEIKKMNQESDLDLPSTSEANQFMQQFEIDLANAARNQGSYESELEKLNKQSKSLGNWRTGLMAGGTVTNISGAAIAGTNHVSEDLKTRIEQCNSSIKDLRDSMTQARIEGRNIGNTEQIISQCGMYEYADLTKIDNRATGAMWSSIVGATTGAAGTVTSAMANSTKIRDDNTDSGKQKEKNLNTASNVLAGASTVASAAATAFNAAQISAIKKVSEIADNCEKELAK